MGKGEEFLDKRPVVPGKPKMKTIRSTNGKSYQVKEGALETTQRPTEEPSVVPEMLEGTEKTNGKKAVTFFSRFKGDVILMDRSKWVQVGQNKWVAMAARSLQFNKHRFTTDDPEVIEYLRNPHKMYEGFQGYGRDVFEVDKPEHKERIHQLTDEGLEEYLLQLHREARKVEKIWVQPAQ